MKGWARRADQKPKLPLPKSRIEHADLTEEDERLAIEIWLEIGRKERLASAGEHLAVTGTSGVSGAVPAATGAERT